MREGRLTSPDDVDAAVIEGASTRVRPLLMTVATTVLGLLPLLWESGVGADVTARTAAPVVGGLWSCMFLTLLVSAGRLHDLAQETGSTGRFRAWDTLARGSELERVQPPCISFARIV